MGNKKRHSEQRGSQNQQIYGAAGQPNVRNPRRQRKKEEETGLLWTILAFFSIVAAVLFFTACGLTNWRKSKAVVMNYVDGSYSYRPTSYGLYNVKFSGGLSSTSWDMLRSQICSATDAMLPWLTSQNTFGAKTGCPSICVDHYVSRCSGWKQMATMGYLMMSMLIVSGCLALLATAWVFVFGPSLVFLTLFWGIGAALPAFTLGYWIWASDVVFKRLTYDSNFPYPSITDGVFLTISGASLLGFCAVFSLIAGWLDERKAWAAKQAEIDARVIAESGAPMGGAPFGGGGAGLMGAMPAPAMYARPAAGYRPPGAVPAGYGNVQMPVRGPPMPMGGLTRPGMPPPSARPPPGFY